MSGFIDVCHISFGIKGKITQPFEFLVYIQIVFGGGHHVFFFLMGGEVVYILVIHFIRTLRIRCK